jgi:hypothetical protein
MSFRTIVPMIAVACAAFGVQAASAGEVTGNGKPLWTNTTDWNAPFHTLHGASACAFSGQEDTQFPESPDYDPNSGHAQSWGQIPKAVRDSFPAEMHPGIACNPHLSSGAPE